MQAFKTALPELPLSSCSDSCGERSCPWNSTTQLTGDFCFLIVCPTAAYPTVTNSSKKSKVPCSVVLFTTKAQ